MEWQIVIALIVAIPFMLIPLVFIWYLNIGGIHAVIKESRERKLARKKKAEGEAVAKHHINVSSSLK